MIEDEKFLEAVSECGQKMDALEEELNALYFNYYRRRYGTAGIRWLFGYVLLLFKYTYVLRCRDRYDLLFRVVVFVVFLLALVGCLFDFAFFLFSAFGGSL